MPTLGKACDKTPDNNSSRFGIAINRPAIAIIANIERADFQRSVQLIAQDNDASWCRLANGQGVKGDSGTQYCAIAMPEFQPEEEDEGGE